VTSYGEPLVDSRSARRCGMVAEVAAEEPGEGSVAFSADHAEFRRQGERTRAKLEVAVATDDDCGIAQVDGEQSLTPHRQIEIIQLHGASR